MASLFQLPDYDPSVYINIPQTSESFLESQYRTQSTKEQSSYGHTLKKNRNISPRFKRFINWWKERFHKLIKACSGRHKAQEKELEVLDDELQFERDALLGEDGLCATLIDTFNLMAEWRIKADYGDYLGVKLTPTRHKKMDDLRLRIERMDWQVVAERVQAEHAEVKDNEKKGIPPPPTPFLDDIAKAADRLGHDKGNVIYQILAYANKIDLGHSAVKAMVERGSVATLAERILEDLRSLDAIFVGRPKEQIQMRKVIKIVEREWFEKLYYEENEWGKRPAWVPTAKCVEVMNRQQRS
ncbi:hypothetical protein ACLMJK_007058 [Lecanora helva]